MSTTTATVGFSADVEQIGERLLVRLPAEASAALPSRGQVAVDGTLDDRPFSTVVEPDGRRGHWLNLDGEDVVVGEAVHVELTPVSRWPEPVVPEDLQEALADAPDIADMWDEITPMARWEWVRWVKSTKSAATRARRVEVTVSKMRSGKRRPCCFDTSACTDPMVAKSGKLIELP